MKFQFRLKNGKTHEFTLPDDVEVRRAIMWVSKGDKGDKEDRMTRFIIIPDDVESVEVIEDN